MQGQANHFNKYAPEKIPYAQKRTYAVPLSCLMTDSSAQATPTRRSVSTACLTSVSLIATGSPAQVGVHTALRI